jgi:predicted DNA-binding transcriptional regulator AlpA
MGVATVSGVANFGAGLYNGGMAKSRNDNELTASEAMQILGIRSKPLFYKLVRSAKNPQGPITPRPRPFSSGRYSWYDRAEVERVLAEELARQNRVSPTGQNDH